MNHVKSTETARSDEFAAHTPRESVIRYNIAEDNSDDGIDTWLSLRNVIEYNFRSKSGTGPRQGDGNGFKLGGPGGLHTVRYNLSRDNRAKPFTNNGGRDNTFENNVALGNRPGDGGKGVLHLRSEQEWDALGLSDCARTFLSRRAEGPHRCGKCKSPAWRTPKGGSR